MAGEKDVFETMVTEFPRSSAKLTGHYQESRSFPVTCEDYLLCLGSIRRLEKQRSPQANELKDL